MPIQFTFDAAGRVALGTLTGSADGPSLMGACRALVETPEWTPGWDVIWDGRGITRLELGDDDIAAIVRLKTMRREIYGTGREVLVVTALLRRLNAEIYASFSRLAGREVYVCASVAEAVETLGVTGLSERFAAHAEGQSEGRASEEE